MRVVETGGVVLPGLIDLHGHPEFNVFAAWEPSSTYRNRYQWRASEAYHALVRDPQNKLLVDPGAPVELAYAEVRALVGGVTAIQGAGGATRHQESLVRNVDGWVFGQRRARAMIDLPDSLSGRGGDQLAADLRAIAAGEVDVLYLHLAEGLPSDARSAAEFPRLVELGALTPATLLIHGTALTPPQFEQLAAEGRGLVWSPQSHLRLYGTTTDAAAARAAGVRLGLGADWLPSGSTSLLAEMKVARRELAQQGSPIEPADLVRMVTSGAAALAGLDAHLGTLAAGRAADVLVLERHHDDPWEDVCEADPSWVELVVLDGAPAYGRADWMASLRPAGAPPADPLIAWGKPVALDTGTSAPLPQTRAALIAQYPAIGPIFA
ncbi:amidohydrolase family protein [Motilibacter rhizosphaerae]|uniref:amidohydrolase family protein n=1 Tax=Motilibacter rhizosphaerae TaxID=598652 RepID=UPI0013EEA496|nr:amidohydrolase family protein [Motilibacter rhizosphaerae]